MKPEPLKDKEIEPPVGCHGVVFDYYDIHSAVEWLKENIRKEAENPYSNTPNIHAGIILKWINESFEDVKGDDEE